MSPQTIRLKADRVELAGSAFGDPAASPVLFFHGGGQSRSAWLGSAIAVAKAGYYGISVDLRGHGDSEWAADGDYLLDAYARDVERLLAHFARPVTLVGASRGGQAALVGGSRHPGRVRLIMLADVAPLMEDSGINGIRNFFAEGAIGFATLDEAADSLSRNLDQPRLVDSARLARAMRQDPSGHWHWRWDPATGRAEFLHPPSEGEALLAAAARVTSPVMLVRAEHSHLVTDAGVDRFRALAPQLEVIIAKGAGHMFTADRNDAFAAELLACLARIPEGVPA
ncbi:MAG: alpha/beta fold hydrolase [Blastomonas fulva]|uniref:alpha/beta fold hydrolase n=1 Tax=Blastomonas TaxID=150203 RepID=UPI0006B987FC|nr:MULTISPECIES: alpha/beta hydrolase [unclassified Blastomonas]AOG02161.1 alpha/beta hydrolase family protein [Blastomonas sp. RAC04]KPF74061.1 alpha/beta hydrolase [Blastomonas sp. AAP25]